MIEQRLTLPSLPAPERRLRVNVLIVSITALLASCATPTTTQRAEPAVNEPVKAPVASTPVPITAPVAAAPAPPPVLPLDDALLAAANNLFSSAAKTLAMPPTQRLLVIDPLVDGVSHTQTVTTQSLETKIQSLVRSKYPGFNAQPFSRSTVSQAPIVLVGTFTAIDLKNQTGGARDAFRICLALADLKSGLIVAKGVARANIEGVNLTPLPHLQDAPAWTKDPSVDAYVQTCQGTKPGDRIDPAYLDGILAASLIAEASDLFDSGRYQDAIEVYRSACEKKVISSASRSLQRQRKLSRRPMLSGLSGTWFESGCKQSLASFLFRPVNRFRQ